MNQTIVFVGPTLSAEEINSHLSEACIHEPIQCGDVLKILRLHPSRLIIIDGYYEITASVWHKEILLALQRGVEVIGAASMGALRAAELTPSGMIGIGEIYLDYYNNVLNDDDEVAVLHRDAEHGFAAQNEAMVNIRATIALAKHQQVISEEQYEALLKTAKSLFYPQRQYSRIISTTEAEYGFNLSAFQSWLPAHKVNLKQRDAIAALDWANENPPVVPAATLLNDTIYLKRLTLEMNASVFNHSYPWLPGTELQTRELAITHQPAALLTRELAMTLNLIYCTAVNESSELHWIQDKEQYLPEDCHQEKWLIALNWLQHQRKTLDISDDALKATALLTKFLFFNKNQLLENNYSKALSLFSLAFTVMDKRLDASGFSCKPDLVRQYRTFLVQNELKLFNEASLDYLLSRMGVTKSNFEYFLTQVVRFRLYYKYFLGLSVTPIKHIPVDNWLLCALIIAANEDAIPARL